MNANESKLLALACLGVFSGCALAATGDSAQKPVPPNTRAIAGPLAPADTQIVQRIGRAVLAARQSATPNPAAEAMRQELKALGAELNQAVLTIANTPPKLTLGKARKVTAQASTGHLNLIETNRTIHAVRNASGQFEQQNIAPSPAVAASLTGAPVSPGPPEVATWPSTHFDGVRRRADSLHQSAATLSTQRTGDAADAMLARVATLRDDIHAALDSPSTGDGSSIAKLRDRLRPRTMAEVLAGQRAAAQEAGVPLPEPTPTISTLIRHR